MTAILDLAPIDGKDDFSTAIVPWVPANGKFDICKSYLVFSAILKSSQIFIVAI